jgi:type IV pilus assembly protein PilM
MSSRWLGGTTRSPIGVDLGGRTIKLVQLSQRRGEWQLDAAVLVPQPVPNHPVERQTAKYLRDVAARHGFVGNRIVLAASNRQLEVDVLELPPRESGAPVEQIARMELARAAKLENDSFELECWDLPAPTRGGSGTSVMAVAMRHQHADALLEPFETVGFNVVAIDARCWTLARACSAYESPGTITAVLNIGWNAALLVLVRSGVVVYQRTLADSGLSVAFNAIGEEFHLDEEETGFVLQHLGVSEAVTASPELTDITQSAPQIRQLISRLLESMVDQIEAAVHYALHRYAETPVTNLLLVGGGAGIAGVCGFLSSRLSIPQCKVLSPAAIVRCSPEMAARGASDGILTAALGLAWYGEDKQKA